MWWAGDPFRDVSPICSWDRLHLMIPKGINGKDIKKDRSAPWNVAGHGNPLQGFWRCRYGVIFSRPSGLSWPKQAGDFWTFVPCFSSTSDSERHKRWTRTCECVLQEAEVVPRDRRQVLVCHGLLQNPSNRLTTSQPCVHLMQCFSNSEVVPGGGACEPDQVFCTEHSPAHTAQSKR